MEANFKYFCTPKRYQTRTLVKNRFTNCLIPTDCQLENLFSLRISSNSYFTTSIRPNSSCKLWCSIVIFCWKIANSSGLTRNGDYLAFVWCTLRDIFFLEANLFHHFSTIKTNRTLEINAFYEILIGLAFGSHHYMFSQKFFDKSRQNSLKIKTKTKSKILINSWNCRIYYS